MQNKEKKLKKVVFSETIDSAINGYALGISFAGVGLFLLLNPNYFSAPIVSYILGAIIGVFGVLGTGIELSKSSKVKGLGHITMGMAFLGIWLFGYLKVHVLWLNILLFFLLVLGCYGICLGLFQGVYSVIRNLQDSKKKESADKSSVVGKTVTQIVLLLTQLCGLILAVINVIKAISV